MLRSGELVIGAHNWQTQLSPVIGGEQKMHGLKPRDMQRHPCGSIPGVPVASIAKIPRSEWKERIADKTKARTHLSQIRDTGMYGTPIPSRDQNGKGYCWAHSTVSAALLARARDNQPYADLSAFAIACMIKGFRDEGGWNGESMQFIREKGCPTSAFWAQRSMDRANDNPKTWENAALHKMTEWADIPEGDFDMQATYALLGFPIALDLNWWSHSICGADLVDGTSSFNAGLCRSESGKLMTLAEFEFVWETDVYGDAFGERIWNSWGDSYGTAGFAVLTEGKARNNGAIANLSMMAAAA